MRFHTFVTLLLMSLVLVWLLALHVHRAIEKAKPVVMTYEEFQRIW